MSEPSRLRDDGPEELRDLLRAGARTRPITPDQRARTGKRLARYASAAAVAAGLSWVPAAALGAGLGAATVLVAWVVPAWIAPAPPPAPSIHAPSPPRSAAPPSPEAPSPSAVPSSSASATSSAAPEARSTAPPTTPPSSMPPGEKGDPPATDQLAEEVALLDQARAALAASPEQALALADAHAARYPRGKLRMERELLIVDALRRLGRTGEARTRAEAMLARAQGSLYEERVRKLLEQMK
ncbi:serine/threonine protein kinase [Minicystis rosea]|nr:serine/threonine protein kinase [Minicystis rosea]